MEWLADICDGDARIALNSLHMALKTRSESSGPTKITLDDIQEGIKVCQNDVTFKAIIIYY